MKKTAFHEIHEGLNAKIVAFAGFLMPIQYEGIIAEHKRVRETVGVFDVSHMGEFELRGAGAFAFAQKMTVNDVTKLFEGRVQYSAMCYDDGGIVDDLLVYHRGDHVLLVVNGANVQKEFDWLQSHLTDDVELIDRSDDTSLLAVQGPRSLDTLKKLTDLPIENLEYYHFTSGKIAGIDALISRTGYTGELGFEIYFDADPALGKKMWDAIFEAGKEFNIGPIGLGARDTLRLEMGYCLYGNDIDQTTNPLEANLGWITKLNKGDFVGRDAMLRAKEKGLQRKLVGMYLEGKAFPRHGYDIEANGNSKAGVVTSGTVSPILEKGIAMGYVPLPYAEEGKSVNVVIRNQNIPATITKVPFLKK